MKRNLKIEKTQDCNKSKNEHKYKYAVTKRCSEKTAVLKTDQNLEKRLRKS